MMSCGRCFLSTLYGHRVPELVNIGYDLGVNTGPAVRFTTDGNVVFMDTVALEIYMASLTFSSILGAWNEVYSDRYGRGAYLVSQAFLLVLL